MLKNPIIFHLGPIPITLVIVITWGVMAAIVLAALFARLTLRNRNPGIVQQVIEAMLNWLCDEIKGIIGRDPWAFLPLIASLFIFIISANFVSFFSSFATWLIPPTSNINTTAGLALVVFLAVPYYGVTVTGTFNFLKTYVQPTWIMLPFNLISDLSRTLALAVRLFGNILSGEILFGVILSLVPFILPLGLMFLSLITGTIQAYIFAVLATVYIGGAVKVVEKHEMEEPAQ